VGDPSNFPRLLELHGHSYEALCRNVEGVVVTEEETRATIRELYKRTGYLLDPHSAVGYAALGGNGLVREPVAQAVRVPADWSAQASGVRKHPAGRPPGLPHVVLATAHPAKFGGVIEQELGFVPALPEAYRDWAARPLHVHALEDTGYDGFRDWLTSEM
jgi:threonine synthase